MQHRVIYYKIIPPWSWDEYFEFMHTANQMMDTVPHMVHIIADLSEITHLPPHLFENFRRITPLLHKRSGQVIVIHNNRLFNAVYGVLKRIEHPLIQKFVIVSSLEMAHDYLHSHTWAK